jgi:hypothetical protein
MVGRFIAAVLISVLGGPLASPWAAAAGAAPGCSEGVCVCSHHVREKAAESAPCHGADESREPRCEMRAACRHQLPGVAATPTYLLPAAVTVARQPRVDMMAARPARLPLPGLRPVELLPPRAS